MAITENNSGRKNFWMLVVFGAILLPVLAYYNGYPVVEGDTGSYIFHGFKPVLPADRSVFYCLFVRFASFSISLWFTLLVQSLLLSFSLVNFIQFFYPEGLRLKTGAIIITCIIIFTQVSWVAGFIMPDAITSVLFLTTITYLVGQGGKLVNIILIIATTLMHNSHFAIVFLFAVMVVIVALIFKNKILKRRSFLLVLLSVWCWLAMCTIHFVRGHGFVYSRGTDVFLMARVGETPILRKYLDDSCGKKDLKLCAYQQQFPMQSIYFLWEGNTSPLYKMGGWDSGKAEHRTILKDIFTTPVYLRMFAGAAVAGTIEQLSQLQVDEIPKLEITSAPGQAIEQYFPNEFNAYLHSRQTSGSIKSDNVNVWFEAWFILSCIAVIFSFKRVQSVCPQLSVIYMLLFLFIVCNAFITATFSTVWPRFEYRVLWGLTATNIIILLKFTGGKKVRS